MAGEHPGPDSTSADRTSRLKHLAGGLAFSALFFCLLLEIAARSFWAYWLDVPFFHAGELRTAMHFAYYPNLKPVYEAEIRRDDDVFDVLMLGGSVINPWYGDIESELQRKLEAALGRPVRTYNVSFPAHGSRDSYNKYRQLGHQRFDLVLVYHAINDVPVNNIARADFRDDYTHYTWHRGYRRLTEHPSVTLPYLAFPYTIRFGLAKIAERLPLPGTVPRKNDERFRASFFLGADLKTPPAFRANLDSIAVMGARRGDPVVLMTFAWYLADGYSLEKFQAKQLDYGAHLGPIELWGDPANVVRGLEAHNRMVREVVEDRHTLFVDQWTGIPDGKAYFDDLVHLAPGGVSRWVDNVILALPPEWFPARPDSAGAGVPPR